MRVNVPSVIVRVHILALRSLRVGATQLLPLRLPETRSVTTILMLAASDSEYLNAVPRLCLSFTTTTHPRRGHRAGEQRHQHHDDEQRQPGNAIVGDGHLQRVLALIARVRGPAVAVMLSRAATI